MIPKVVELGKSTAMNADLAALKLIVSVFHIRFSIGIVICMIPYLDGKCKAQKKTNCILFEQMHPCVSVLQPKGGGNVAFKML
jgi:hypothetical protein